MKVEELINLHISSHSEPKRSEMESLHHNILELMPGCKLWFLDGKDENGKIITNPNIGYGSYIMKYADRSTREFYQIGVSANTTGISVYIMGIKDKTYLPKTYGSNLGKASVTGYCIKFKSLKDINFDILKEAILFGVATTNKKS